MDDLPLAAEFPPATRERWLALVEGVLKGADFDKKLVSSTYDRIRVEPLYGKANAEPVWGPRGPWRVAQRVDHPDAAGANELALEDLAGGADALTIVLDGAASEPWGRRSADVVAAAIPGAERATLEGQTHEVASESLAPVLAEFFGRC